MRNLYSIKISNYSQTIKKDPKIRVVQKQMNFEQQPPPPPLHGSTQLQKSFSEHSRGEQIEEQVLLFALAPGGRAKETNHFRKKCGVNVHFAALEDDLDFFHIC